MSRHHMTLPPPIYTPPPKAKPAPRRTNVGRVFKRGSTSRVGDAEESDEPEDVRGVGRQVNPLAGRSQRDDSSRNDDAQKFKSRSMPGLLGDSTLKAMLVVQELANTADDNGEMA